MKVAEIVMINAPKNYYECNSENLKRIIPELRKKFPYDRNDHINIIEMTPKEYLEAIL